MKDLHLNDCPLCGSDEVYLQNVMCGNQSSRAVCPNCNIACPHACSQEKAIEAWNALTVKNPYGWTSKVPSDTGRYVIWDALHDKFHAAVLDHGLYGVTNRVIRLNGTGAMTLADFCKNKQLYWSKVILPDVSDILPEILPCKVCGKQPVWRRDDSDMWLRCYDPLHNIQTRLHTDKQSAIDEWNSLVKLQVSDWQQYVGVKDECNKHFPACPIH